MSRISATLTTIGFSEASSPLFSSLMPYVLHQRWYFQPLIALRTDENHYKNVQATPKCSLMFNPITPISISPVSVPIPRVNATGTIQPITSQDDIAIILDKYQSVHPGSQTMLGQEIFHFYQFCVSEVHLMSSVGKLVYLTGDELQSAVEDPIAPVSRKLIENVNTEHKEELKKMCKKYGEVEVSDAFVYGMDRLGFDIMGKEADSGKWLVFRMPWPNAITNAEEYKLTVVQALKETSEN